VLPSVCEGGDFMERRERILTLRVNDREAAIFDAAAKAEGMSLSDYLRVGAMTCAVQDGRVDAIKYVGAKVMRRMVEKLKKLVPAEERHLL
jgi:hypothetical protein